METQQPVKENKMGIMPVNRLLLSMSLPMVLSMLVQALYNIVDSIFVSRIGEDALTAVSLVFPMQNLMIAIGVGTGVGINALLSKCLGEKNYHEANNAANNGIFLQILYSIVFLVIGLFFSERYMRMQTDTPQIVAYGVDYMTICCIGSFGLFGQITLERLLSSTGKTVYTMLTQAVGAIVNIILDPILIFGYFGFPKMGVPGAAVATVIGQVTGMLLGLIFNLAVNREIALRLKGFRPRAGTIKRIYAVGAPSILMASIGSVMVFGMNQILIAFSDTASAVIGVYFKLQSFIFMPVFGLNNGMVPILSYNYGARKRGRMVRTIRLSILYAVGIMLVGLLIFQIAPIRLLALFDASENMIAIGVIALRTISVGFLFAGYCIVCSSVFQALGNGMLSLTVSVIRQLVVLLPAAWLLSRTGNLNLVWLAFPIAEIFSVTLCTIFLKKIYNQIIRFIPAN